MRQWIRSHLTYSNVMVTILAFVVLGGGTALASFVVSSNSQVGPNTISGHHPPSGKNANLIPASVNGQDVADNSLRGADINESSLARVPWAGNAILGGTGRSSQQSDTCNPETTTYVSCADVSITIPDSSRILVSGQANAALDVAPGNPSAGNCMLGEANHGLEPNSKVYATPVDFGASEVTTTAVWGPFPAGTYSFGIACDEYDHIRFLTPRVTAVALSGN
jgi:hypothetical protein